MVQVERNPAEALIDAAGEAGRDVIEHEGLRHRGEHDALSRAEIEVFRIDPSLAVALDEALNWYQDLLEAGCGSSDDCVRQFAADLKEHQAYLPEASDGRPKFEPFLAAAFMNEVCGLPYDQCWAWVWKQEFVQWREGHFILPDEIVSADYRRRVREAEASGQTTPPASM